MRGGKTGGEGLRELFFGERGVDDEIVVVEMKGQLTCLSVLVFSYYMGINRE